MLEKKKPRFLIRIRPETFLMIAIICCTIFIMEYNRTERMHGYVAIEEDGSITILHTKEKIEESKSRGVTSIGYQSDACRIIEVYDAALNETFHISFINLPENFSVLENYPEILNMAKENESGQLSKELNNETVTIYYKWSSDDIANRYLVVYVSSLDTEVAISHYIVICYLAIILSFLVLTISIYWQCRGITNKYMNIRNEVRSRIHD